MNLKSFFSKQFFSYQFTLFVVIGSVAATTNFFSRIFYEIYYSFSTSIVLAYCTGMLVAFLLDKRFVFKNSQNHVSVSIFFFVIVNLFGLIQTWCITMFLSIYFLPSFGVVFFLKEISHAFGIAFPAFTSFLGHKYITFK